MKLKIASIGVRRNPGCYLCLMGEPVTGRNELGHYHDGVMEASQ